MFGKKEWEVDSKVRHGKVRGYTGINLRTRPRRQPSVEFGGRIMLKRIQHYISNFTSHLHRKESNVINFLP